MKETQFKHEMAKLYLEFFGNKRPAAYQMRLMQSLLPLVLSPAELSKREWQCLYVASYGKSVKETAQILGIEVTSVKTYRKNGIKKLGGHNILHAISKSIRHRQLQSKTD